MTTTTPKTLNARIAAHLGWLDIKPSGLTIAHGLDGFPPRGAFGKRQLLPFYSTDRYAMLEEVRLLRDYELVAFRRALGLKGCTPPDWILDLDPRFIAEAYVKAVCGPTEEP